MRIGSRRNRRESRDGPIAVRIAEADIKAPWPAHRMAADGFARRVHRQLRVDDADELLCECSRTSDSGPPKAPVSRSRRSWRLFRHPSTSFFTRDIDATRARVGNDERQAERGRVALCAGFDAEILFGAGQSREPIQCRHRAASGRRGQIRCKSHRAIAHFRTVLVSDLASFKALRFAQPTPVPSPLLLRLPRFADGAVKLPRVLARSGRPVYKTGHARLP